MVANPRAHFYVSVSKDDNQIFYDKILTVEITQLCIKNEEDKQLPGFYLLGGSGGSFPPKRLSFPPKSFTEKKLQLFQIKIFFDDDFKESVKGTNVQKCDFSQSLTLYFQNFPGEHALEGPP